MSWKRLSSHCSTSTCRRDSFGRIGATPVLA
jgi:hypothetical protein